MVDIYSIKYWQVRVFTGELKSLNHFRNNVISIEKNQLNKTNFKLRQNLTLFRHKSRQKYLTRFIVLGFFPPSRFFPFLHDTYIRTHFKNENFISTTL